MPGAYGLQQAGYAQCGVCTQLQRVHVLVVHPLEQHVDGLQTLERLEVQPFITHYQVAALHQGQAQVAGQVGVFEIGFVVGARRQQGDVRVGTGRALRLEAFHQRPVGGGQALHMHALEGRWELPRHRQPVFQQVAQPRRCLAALSHQPPQAVGPAGQVERGHVQVAPFGTDRAVHGPHVARVAVHQRGG